MKFACIGLDHRHIYGMTEGMIKAGATCEGFFTRDSSEPLEGFKKRFPNIPRVNSPETLINDKKINLILCAAIPSERAEYCIKAMLNGKDVMVDKPGMTTLKQLEEIIEVQKKTNARYSIDFSEHFEVPATLKAKKIIDSGEIGSVIQTIGLGPHRHNPDSRRPWFYEKKKFGGIINDIASHQIDQFLWLTGSKDAQIINSSVANYTNFNHKEFEDFGEILIRGKKSNGYIRVDWYTPDKLPNWGDGRLFVQGTKGYIEIRKYVDILGQKGTDHLFLVTDKKYEKIECGNEEITYFKEFYSDVINRTEISMTHEHCFKVCKLALDAQINAIRLN